MDNKYNLVARCIEFLKSQVDENDDLGKNFTTESITNYMRKLIKVHDNRFDQAINRNDLQRINVYQFRVYFDTELRKRGFNDFQIAKMMGHKDEKMLGYYAREVDSIQEDIEYMEVKKDNKDLVRRINKLEQEKSKLEKENALLTNIKLN